jgi:hypothetical protein
MQTLQTSRVMTALYVVVGGILIALTILVWCHPAAEAANHGLASAPAMTARTVSDPCDEVVGPARDVCLRSTPRTATTASLVSTASVGGVKLGRAAVLVPATIAISAAIALVMVDGRLGRRPRGEHLVAY